MIIINQWATDHVDYHTNPISIDKKSDTEYILRISDKEMASGSKCKIHKLYQRIVHFIDHYKRDIDTFDIGAELKFMDIAKCSSFGSYFS